MKWKSMQMPKELVLDEKSATDYYGKFIIEPLERGFGITLGNALRRVLLSSIQGAAVVAARIEGMSCSGFSSGGLYMCVEPTFFSSCS